MKSLLLWTVVFCATCTFAQIPPKLYIHFVSHNEPTDNFDANILNYNKAKTNALQMANLVNTKNVRWNLQTSDGFVVGALNFENAGTSSTDIFETLSKAPYDDNIEIDPRSKNKSGRNIADQWYLIDSCGANPSHHLGGFIYSTTNSVAQPIDWLQYRNPIIGNIYGNSWQCNLLTGAGSYPPHTNDLNDFGIFKPDTTTNFYQHNAAKNLWCMGTGCAPVLDSMSNEQAIIDLIQGQVDSIQTGLWPSNKFYVTRIMTNQREYGPLFFQKVTKVIDSLALIPNTKLQWATISETFAAFQSWQISSGLGYSQWLCGQTTTSVTTHNLAPTSVLLYPNPCQSTLNLNFMTAQLQPIVILDATGKTLFQTQARESFALDISEYPIGIYWVKVGDNVQKIVKTE